MTDGAPGIVPAAASVQRHGGVARLSEDSRVASAPRLLPAVRRWRRAMEEAFGLPLPLVPPESLGPGTRGEVSPGTYDVVFVHDDELPPGGYAIAAHAGAGDTSRGAARAGKPGRVAGGAATGSGNATVAGGRLVVRCADLAGAHAAAQTLRQLAGPDAFRSAPIRGSATGRAPGRPAAGAAAVPAADAGPGAPAGPFPWVDPAAHVVVALPAVTIEDHPRFGWRGVLLDVARHFLPKHDVLRFVDLAAMHKLNVLQLHLTDDQGWRFQVLRYPELTQAGAWRAESTVGTWRTGTPDGTPHGGFYTQDDLREIVAYARERGIVVVPEIDVPGHVEAATAAYPFLGTSKRRRGVRTTWGISEDVLDPSEESLALFRHVLDEVADVFDGPWIHLGGDEVPTALWESSAHIRARAAALGFVRDGGEPDVARLHGWFLARLAGHVRGLGRRAVVWDEAFGPELPRDVVVMAWRSGSPGVASRAVAAGHDVVVAPEAAWYLDHRGGDHPDEPLPVGFLRTVEDALAYDPANFVPAPRPADGVAQEPTRPGRLLGGQAQVWTEHLDSARRIDYAAFPRLAAVAEVLWSPAADRVPGTTTSAEFLRRLAAQHLPRLDAAGVEYRPAAGPHPWQTRPGVPSEPRDLAKEMVEAREAETRLYGPAAGALAGLVVNPRSAFAGVAGPSAGRPAFAGFLGPSAGPRPALAEVAGLSAGPRPVQRAAGASGPGGEGLSRPGRSREVGVVRGVRVPEAGGGLSPLVDLRIGGGRVVRVEPAAASSSDVDGIVLDGGGRIALPGFVDAHSHAEGTVFDPDVQLALLRQGVTTVVTGQDGVSYAPGDGAWAGAYFAGILGEHRGYRGPRVRDLLATYDGVVPVNVAYLAPHGTLRHEVLGGNPKRATLKELAHMARLLRQALDDGACGLSTGLEYLPGGYADERELVTLAAVVAKRGLPHVSHMRGYEDKAGDAFAELMRIARASGVATHVSHYHGPAPELAGYVDEARADGLDVTFDSYPYLRGCSTLAMVALPAWLPLADPAATVRALRDPAVAERLRREHFGVRGEGVGVRGEAGTGEPGGASGGDGQGGQGGRGGRGGAHGAAGPAGSAGSPGGLDELWPRITFASVPAIAGERNLTWAEGRTLTDVARLLGVDVPDAVVEVLTATALRATCVFAQPPGNTADWVRALAAHPAHLGGSDAIYLGGRPHPRGWGAFTRLLAHYAGLGAAWDSDADPGPSTGATAGSWHAAAEHLSGRAARRFGFAGRGSLAEGSVADVVLVDPDALRDRATYDLPRVAAAGIDDVLVAAVPVLADGALTGATPGGPLRPGRPARRTP